MGVGMIKKLIVSTVVYFSCVGSGFACNLNNQKKLPMYGVNISGVKGRMLFDYVVNLLFIG